MNNQEKINELFVSILQAIPKHPNIQAVVALGRSITRTQLNKTIQDECKYKIEACIESFGNNEAQFVDFFRDLKYKSMAEVKNAADMGNLKSGDLTALTWANIFSYLNNLDTEQNQTEQITIPDNILQALADKGILQALAEKKFIENTTDSPLKWLKTKSLLAYFVDVANDKLELKKGEKRQITPFENLFSIKNKSGAFVNVTGITSTINEYKNKTGSLPENSEQIDELFESKKATTKKQKVKK